MSGRVQVWPVTVPDPDETDRDPDATKVVWDWRFVDEEGRTHPDMAGSGAAHPDAIGHAAVDTFGHDTTLERLAGPP